MKSSAGIGRHRKADHLVELANVHFLFRSQPVKLLLVEVVLLFDELDLREGRISCPRFAHPNLLRCPGRAEKP
jgi:hypothetical protein